MAGLFWLGAKSGEISIFFAKELLMSKRGQIRIEALDFLHILEYGGGYYTESKEKIYGNFVAEDGVIRIENATVFSGVSISNKYFNKPIELSYVNFLSRLEFESATFQSILFSNCHLSSLVRFDKVKISHRLGFDNARFVNTIELASCECHEFFVESLHFQVLEIHRGSFSKFILRHSNLQALILSQTVIKNAFIEHECSIDNINCNGSTVDGFSIIFCTINKVALNSSRFSTFNISMSTIAEDIGFELSTMDEELHIHASAIKEFRLGIKDFKKARLVKTPVLFLTINMEIARDSVLVVEDCTIQHLNFDSMKNNGSIRLLHIVSPELSSLSILNSDLGRTDFIRCAFNKAIFNFSNSKIAESFLAETDFPTRVFSNGQVNHQQAQLAFGQLQTAYQRQGDNVRANEYQAREIEAHYRTLAWSRKNFFTKLNLFFNWISNNFGRNWAQGALFSIAVGLLFFYFLVLSSEEFHFALNFSHFPDLVDSFLKFMNPLRHFETENLFQDKQPVVNATPGTYILDFAGRIFVTYGYYQTIQAFRRFGKK